MCSSNANCEAVEEIDIEAMLVTNGAKSTLETGERRGQAAANSRRGAEAAGERAESDTSGRERQRSPLTADYRVPPSLGRRMVRIVYGGSWDGWGSFQ